MLAHAYGDVNQSALALKTWEAAIHGAPDAGNMHNEYGYELINAGRYDEAIVQLEEYRRLNPREPNPYDSLGEARLMLGEPERSLEAFGTALTIDPQFFESLRRAAHGRSRCEAVMTRRYPSQRCSRLVSHQAQRARNHRHAPARLAVVARRTLPRGRRRRRARPGRGRPL